MSLQADITKDHGFFIGEDKALVFDIVDMNSKPAVPVDITSYTIHWELSDTYSGPAFTVLVAENVTPLAGRCVIVIPSAVTIDLAGDTGYFYSLRRIDDGSRDELAFGNVYLRDVWVDYP